jgi:hypothetical protein
LCNSHDDKQQRRLAVLFFDEGECGASTDRVFADNSLSSLAGV